MRAGVGVAVGDEVRVGSGGKVAVGVVVGKLVGKGLGKLGGAMVGVRAVGKGLAVGEGLTVAPAGTKQG